MTSTNPSKSFKNVCDAKHVLKHYEKLKVEDSLDFDEALEAGWLAGWLATDCLFKNSGAATKSRVVSTTNSNSMRSIKTAH